MHNNSEITKVEQLLKDSDITKPQFLVRIIPFVEDKFNRVFCGKNPTKEQAEIIATVGLEFILSLRHILDSNEVQVVHKDTIYSILGKD